MNETDIETERKIRSIIRVKCARTSLCNSAHRKIKSVIRNDLHCRCRGQAAAHVDLHMHGSVEHASGAYVGLVGSAGRHVGCETSILRSYQLVLDSDNLYLAGHA